MSFQHPRDAYETENVERFTEWTVHWDCYRKDNQKTTNILNLFEFKAKIMQVWIPSHIWLSTKPKVIWLVYKINIQHTNNRHLHWNYQK